jgi:D-alanine-D-alanine ligase
MLKDGIPYVMEMNTLPGMTKNSLLPKSAGAAGISFSQLLDQIIEASIQR